MKSTINKLFNQIVEYILLKIVKVNPEYLSPLNWKVVDKYDMLRLVTSENALVLKSSEAVNYKPIKEPKGFQYEYMYKSKHQLIFLTDTISRTENDNLRRYELTFKYKLITIHGKFVTIYIKNIIKRNTDQLLAIAKEYNKANPIKGDFKSQMEFELNKPKQPIKLLTDEELTFMGKLNHYVNTGEANKPASINNPQNYKN